MTGVPGADRVIAAVQALENRPLTEHVAVFEAAEAALRDVLANPQAQPVEGPEQSAAVHTEQGEH